MENRKLIIRIRLLGEAQHETSDIVLDPLDGIIELPGFDLGMYLRQEVSERDEAHARQDRAPSRQ